MQPRELRIKIPDKRALDSLFLSPSRFRREDLKKIFKEHRGLDKGGGNGYAFNSDRIQWTEDGQRHVEFYEYRKELTLLTKNEEAILGYDVDWEWEIQYTGYEETTVCNGCLNLYSEDSLAKKIFENIKIRQKQLNL